MNAENVLWLVGIALGCSVCWLHVRVVKIEARMQSIPTHADLSEIGERLARVEAQMSQIASSIDTMTRLLMEHHK